MDTPVAIYHVARNGQVIGAFSFPALAAQFKSGAVKPTDHYLVEGTTDWKLISELEPKLSDYFKEQERLERERVKAELARIAAEKERQRAIALAAKEEARKAEEAQRADAEARRRKEREDELVGQERAKFWSCLTCQHGFKSGGPHQRYPDAKGLGEASLLIFVAAILAAIAVGALFSGVEGSKFALFVFGTGTVVALAAAAGQIISLGVETGLQRFHSYRPRCPNCSSSHCIRQAE